MNQVNVSGTVWECVRKDRFDAASISVYDGKDRDGKAKYFTLKVRIFHDDNGNGVSAQKGQTMAIVGGQLTSYKYEDKWYWEVKANVRDVYVKGEPRGEASQPSGAGSDDNIPF